MLQFSATASKMSFLIVVIGMAPLAWLLRDGLGPNAVESAGMAAFWRWFQTFWVGPLIIGLGCLSCMLHRVANRDQ